MMRRIILLAFVFTACTLEGFAESVAKLEEIKVEITQNESRIEELRSSMALLQADLKKLNSSIKVIAERESKLKKELSKLQSNQIEVERLISDLRGRLVEVELRARERIRALYMTPRNVSLMRMNADTTQLGRAIKYAAIIRQQDHRDLQRIHELRGLQTAETTKLERLRQQQSALLAESSLQRSELENRKKSVEKIVAEFNVKKKAVEKEILALRSQELRLEALLKGITGGEEERSDNSEQPSEASVKQTQFVGEGFPKDKKKLLFINGSTLIRFGAKSADGAISKGIVVQTKQPSLAAALPARVSFVGKMPRLGTVVILDHGNRDYTLIGRLKGTSVKKGQEISVNESLGEVELDDKGMGQVYVETRREGKAVNPTLIYKTS